MKFLKELYFTKCDQKDTAPPAGCGSGFRPVPAESFTRGVGGKFQLSERTVALAEAKDLKGDVPPELEFDTSDWW